MKTVRFLVVAAALTIGAPQLGWAQDEPKKEEPKAEEPKKEEPKKEEGRRGRRGEMGGSAADRLKEPLGLTEEQIKKIKEIEAAARKEAEEERQKQRESGEPRPDRETMRKRFKEQREKINGKIKETLTDEQKKKFDDYLKKQEEEAKKREEERQKNGGGQRRRGTGPI